MSLTEPVSRAVLCEIRLDRGEVDAAREAVMVDLERYEGSLVVPVPAGVSGSSAPRARRARRGAARAVRAGRPPGRRARDAGRARAALASARGARAPRHRRARRSPEPGREGRAHGPGLRRAGGDERGAGRRSGCARTIATRRSACWRRRSARRSDRSPGWRCWRRSSSWAAPSAERGTEPRRASRCGPRSTSPTAPARPAFGDRARDELRATGARPRRQRLSGPASLTASERRVANLAVEGRTNRQIAQELFVTRKTVEMHLSNAYLKLDIASRGGLEAALGAG